MRWEVNIYKFELLACLGGINCTNVGAQWSTQCTKIVSSIRSKVKSDSQGSGGVIRGVIPTFVPFTSALAATFSKFSARIWVSCCRAWCFIFRECFVCNHSVETHPWAQKDEQHHWELCWALAQSFGPGLLSALQALPGWCARVIQTTSVLRGLDSYCCGCKPMCVPLWHHTRVYHNNF